MQSITDQVPRFPQRVASTKPFKETKTEKIFLQNLSWIPYQEVSYSPPSLKLIISAAFREIRKTQFKRERFTRSLRVGWTLAVEETCGAECFPLKTKFNGWKRTRVSTWTPLMRQNRRVGAAAFAVIRNWRFQPKSGFAASVEEIRLKEKWAADAEKADGFV